jgi:hypothetical protein
MAQWSEQDCKEVILLYHKYAEREGLGIPSCDIEKLAKKINKTEGSVRMKLRNHRFLVTGKEEKGLTNFSEQHKFVYEPIKLTKEI